MRYQKTKEKKLKLPSSKQLVQGEQVHHKSSMPSTIIVSNCLDLLINTVPPLFLAKEQTNMFSPSFMRGREGEEVGVYTSPA